jgi:hypothetical protein
MGNLQEDQCTFLPYFSRFFLEREIFRQKKGVQKITTRILCSVTFYAQ